MDLTRGAGGNSASWLAAAGASVTLLARVGDDAAGATARRELEAAGVRCAFAVDDTLATCMVVILLDAHGDRTMLPDRGANRAFCVSDVDLPSLGRRERRRDGLRRRLQRRPALLLAARRRPVGGPERRGARRQHGGRSTGCPPALSAGVGARSGVSPCSAAATAATGRLRRLTPLHRVDGGLPHLSCEHDARHRSRRTRPCRAGG